MPIGRDLPLPLPYRNENTYTTLSRERGGEGGTGHSQFGHRSLGHSLGTLLRVSHKGARKTSVELPASIWPKLIYQLREDRIEPVNRIYASYCAKWEPRDVLSTFTLL